MKEAFDPCKHFVVLNKIAAFCRGYPALHGRNKLSFPFQVNGKNLLRQSVRVSAFSRSYGLEFGFLFGSKRHFHQVSLGAGIASVNAMRH